MGAAVEQQLVAMAAERVMKSELTEEERARAEAALKIAQAVQTLNDAVAAAAELGIYAKMSIYTPPAEPGRPRQTYSISIVDLGRPRAR